MSLAISSHLTPSAGVTLTSVYGNITAPSITAALAGIAALSSLSEQASAASGARASAATPPSQAPSPRLSANTLDGLANLPTFSNTNATPSTNSPAPIATNADARLQAVQAAYEAATEAA